MKTVLYIDDNKNNISLMHSVVISINSSINYVGTDSVDEFVSHFGEPDTLYIIDFTLDGIFGDSLYEQLLTFDKEAKAIITSAGYISDLQDLFLRFEHKPLAVTDRFGAIEILRKELCDQS